MIKEGRVFQTKRRACLKGRWQEQVGVFTAVYIFWHELNSRRLTEVAEKCSRTGRQRPHDERLCLPQLGLGVHPKVYEKMLSGFKDG